MRAQRAARGVTVRRPTAGPDGTVWYGIFNKGILGKLDPATGKMVEYKVPMATSEPYDVWPDPAGNIMATSRHRIDLR
jgi:streptogramin lyase